MIIVLSVISIVITIVGIRYIIKNTGYRGDESLIVPFGFMCAFGVLSTISSLIFMLIAIDKVAKASVIDDKINMYEEENNHIESSISLIVDNYQKHESDIFKDVADSTSDSSMVLITMYPELKSDALVQEQISIYTSNNEKIKQLKEAQINASVWRWWLYFGH